MFVPRISAIAATLSLAVITAAAADELSSAESLAACGLSRVERVWMLAEELELRQALAELPKRHDRIESLERDLESRIQQNAAAWQETQPALQGLRQALSKLRTDDAQRPVLERQIQTLQAAAVEPAKLGARPDVRAQLVAWTSARNEQIAAARKIRQSLPKLVDRYATLTQNPEIVRAVRDAGERQRLGPQRSYQADLQKLGEYERLVVTNWTPIHWQAGQVRLTGLVDDNSPITFSYIESGEQPTLLTTSAAESAGITIPPDAPQEIVVLTAGRQVKAWRVELPYLRFGACVLRNVPVLVLPPEAEDWGSRIGRQALSGYSLRLQPERFRLWIE